jgi:hypothetical protein
MDMTQLLDVAGYTAVAAVSLKGLVFIAANWTQLPMLAGVGIDSVASHIGSVASHIDLAAARLGF